MAEGGRWRHTHAADLCLTNCSDPCKRDCSLRFTGTAAYSRGCTHSCMCVVPVEHGHVKGRCSSGSHGVSWPCTSQSLVPSHATSMSSSGCSSGRASICPVGGRATCFAIVSRRHTFTYTHPDYPFYACVLAACAGCNSAPARCCAWSHQRQHLRHHLPVERQAGALCE